MHRVMIEPASYKTCGEAVNKVFDLFPVTITGKKVLIKPNALRPSEPEEGVATHPAVLQAVVERVVALKPASLIVGDNPGIKGYGANEETFRVSGFTEASKGYYRNIGTDARDVPFNPKFLAAVKISTAILDADIVISIPKLKTHGLTTISGAIKNCYGYLPGAQKARLHAIAGDPVGFGEMIVDVLNIRVPDLFIMDAVLGMQGNGPVGKDLKHVGKIMATDNPVAMDAIIARMTGIEPHRIHHLRVAFERGFGSYDTNAIEIIGDFQPIPEFNLPPIITDLEDITDSSRQILYSSTLVRPTVNDQLCTGCGTCSEQCPVSALSMIENIPRVDPELCITCFCCQEMCPEAAITLQKQE